MTVAEASPDRGTAGHVAPQSCSHRRLRPGRQSGRGSHQSFRISLFSSLRSAAKLSRGFGHGESRQSRAMRRSPEDPGSRQSFRSEMVYQRDPQPLRKRQSHRAGAGGKPASRNHRPRTFRQGGRTSGEIRSQPHHHGRARDRAWYYGAHRAPTRRRRSPRRGSNLGRVVSRDCKKPENGLRERW